MRNYKICGMKDGRMPMTMPDPADFGDSKKDAITMYHTADGELVILRRSIALHLCRGVSREAPALCSSATIVTPSTTAASAATK